MNSTLEKKKGGKIIGEKEKARSKRKWREMTGKAQGLTKRPYLNISHRCYIFCNCPSGVALRLLHPRAMHQCNIRMTNKPFFYKAGERRFESYMGGKKKEYWGKKKKSTGPKTPLSAYTEKEDSYCSTHRSWRSGKLFTSILLTLILNYLWLKLDDV